LTPEERREAIIEQMDKTRSGVVGPNGIKHRLRLEEGIYLPRAEITKIMREVDPVGFIRRSPGGGVRVQRVPIWGVGPWNQLSVDGHDKLRAFGIYIYGWRDNFSGYVMHLYMGRSNRNLHIINRETIRMFMNYGTEEEGCIPVTIFSDYGSETVESYATFEVLRAHYGPSVEESPVWVYTQSTHNIVIERGWRHWLNQRGKEIETKLKASGQWVAFDSKNPKHQGAVEVAIFPLVQAELDLYVESANYTPVRYQKQRNLPSGGIRVDWFERPEEVSYQNCSINVPREDLKWMFERAQRKIPLTQVDTWVDMFEHYIAENEITSTWNNCWNVWSALIDFEGED